MACDTAAEKRIACTRDEVEGPKSDSAMGGQTDDRLVISLARRGVKPRCYFSLSAVVASTINRSGAGPKNRIGQQVVSVSNGVVLVRSAGASAATTRSLATVQVTVPPSLSVTIVSPIAIRASG